MLAIAIPIGLSAKNLRKVIAFGGKFRGTHRLNVAFASGPQRSNMREFVGKIQKK